MDDYFSLNATKRGLGIPHDNNFLALDKCAAPGSADPAWLPALA